MTLYCCPWCHKWGPHRGPCQDCMNKKQEEQEEQDK